MSTWPPKSLRVKSSPLLEKIPDTRLKIVDFIASDKMLHPNSLSSVIDYFRPTILQKFTNLSDMDKLSVFLWVSHLTKSIFLIPFIKRLLSECFDSECPTITSIINFTLHEGLSCSYSCHGSSSTTFFWYCLCLLLQTSHFWIVFSYASWNGCYNRMHTCLSFSSLTSPFQFSCFVSLNRKFPSCC